MADLDGAVQYAQQSDPMMGLTPEQSAAYLAYLANSMGGGANLAPPLARITPQDLSAFQRPPLLNPVLPSASPPQTYQSPVELSGQMGTGQGPPTPPKMMFRKAFPISMGDERFSDQSIPPMQPHPGFGAPSYGEGQVIPHDVPWRIDESMEITPAIGRTGDRNEFSGHPNSFAPETPPLDLPDAAFFRDANLRQPQTNADTVYTENQEPLAYRIYKAQHPETISDSPFQKVIFGGEKGAANAPPGAGPGMPVDAAKRLEASGANSRDIFLKTGWYHAPDGQWKWTLSDKGADLNKDAFLTYTTGGTGGFGGPTSGEKEEVALKPGGPRKLPDVLSHPTLYQTYPQLKDATVDRLPQAAKDNGALADYESTTNTVRFADNRPKEEIVSSLLHELQHGVQGFEGFGQGGSSSLFLPTDVYLGRRPATQEENDKAFENYKRLAGETEARQVERQYNTRDWTQAPTRLEGFPVAEKQIVRHDFSPGFQPGKAYVPPGKPFPVRRPFPVNRPVLGM